MRNSTAATVSLIFFCAGLAFSADKKIIFPPGAKPGGNYSQGILTGGTLYISGQAGEDADGKIPSDFEAEVQRSLDNIGAILKAAGMSPADVVIVQVYLTDAAKFQQMNAVYRTILKIPGRPVSRLVGPGHVEITVTAKEVANGR